MAQPGARHRIRRTSTLSAFANRVFCTPTFEPLVFSSSESRLRACARPVGTHQSGLTLPACQQHTHRTAPHRHEPPRHNRSEWCVTRKGNRTSPSAKRCLAPTRIGNKESSIAPPHHARGVIGCAPASPHATHSKAFTLERAETHIQRKMDVSKMARSSSRGKVRGERGVRCCRGCLTGRTKRVS